MCAITSPRQRRISGSAIFTSQSWSRELLESLIRYAPGDPYEKLPDEGDIQAGLSCLSPAADELKLRVDAYFKAVSRLHADRISRLAAELGCDMEEAFRVWVARSAEERVNFQALPREGQRMPMIQKAMGQAANRGGGGRVRGIAMAETRVFQPRRLSERAAEPALMKEIRSRLSSMPASKMRLGSGQWTTIFRFRAGLTGQTRRHHADAWRRLSIQQRKGWGRCPQRRIKGAGPRHARASRLRVAPVPA